MSHTGETKTPADLAAIAAAAQHKAAEAKAAAGAAREAAVARKEELITQAHELANSEQWKVAGEKLNAIIEEWKTLPRAGRAVDDALWKRYASARDEFNRRRREHFSALNAARKTAAARKEELTVTAESLSDSTKWESTANQLKKLMAEWKTLPRLSREAEEQLWKRFRTAQDHFFAQRSEEYGRRDAEREDRRVQRDRQLAEQARAKEDAIANNPLLTQMREQVEKARKQLERAKQTQDSATIAAAEASLSAKERVLAVAEQTR